MNTQVATPPVHSLPASLLRPEKPPFLRNASDDIKARADTQTQGIFAHLMIVPHGTKFQTIVSVSDGHVRSTGRILRGAFETEALAWNKGIEEATRMLDLIFCERLRDVILAEEEAPTAEIRQLHP